MSPASKDYQTTLNGTGIKQNKGTKCHQNVVPLIAS
jgi:hypothetical protein